MDWTRDTIRIVGSFTLSGVIGACVVGCSVSKSRSENGEVSRRAVGCVADDAPYHPRTRSLLSPPAIASIQPSPPQNLPQQQSDLIPSDMPALAAPMRLPTLDPDSTEASGQQFTIAPPGLNPQSIDRPPGRMPDSRPPESSRRDEAAWTAEQAVLRLREAGVIVSFDDHGEVSSIDGREIPLTAADIRLFSAFTNLKQLSLHGISLTPAGLAVLSRLTRLEFLGLGQTSISDRDLTSLRSLTALRFLSLAETNITDDAVDRLAPLASLEGINLKGTRVTPAGVAELRRRLPNCRVVSDAGVAQAESLFEQTLQTPISSTERENADSEPSNSRYISRVGYDRQSRPVPAGMNLEGSAEERLRKTLVARLADPEVQLALADVDAEQGDWEAAYMAYRNLSDAAPGDRAIRFRVGQAMVALGDLEGARREFVLALGPAGSHYQLALQHFEARRMQECRRELRESLMWDSTYGPSRELLSLVSAETREAEFNHDVGRRDHAAQEEATVDRLLQALRGTGARNDGGFPSQSSRPPARPGWNVEISPQDRGRIHEADSGEGFRPRPPVVPSHDYDSASPYSRPYMNDQVPRHAPPYGPSFGPSDRFSSR